MKLAQPVSMFIVLSLIAGCSILPTKRSEESAVKTTDRLSSEQNLTVRRVIEGEKRAEPHPMPNVTVSGASNQVEIAINPSPSGTNSHPFAETLEIGSSLGQTAASAEAATGRASVSIPLGVSLGLAAVGLTALVFAVRYAITSARKSSAAVDATLKAVDSEIAARIRGRRTTVASTTDPAEMAWLNSEIADEESLRGRLGALKSKTDPFA